MITGSHSLVYSTDPEADRAFFRDVLKFTSVDTGGGWLIFGLPPSEVAVHPGDTNGVHEFYLMSEDIQAFVTEMEEHKLACDPVHDAGWGLLTRLTLPGGGKLGVYEPRHVRPKTTDDAPSRIPPIRYRTYVNAPPSRVYEMLTTAEGWDAWFTRGTEVDPRPGGRIRFRWVDWSVDHYNMEGGGPVLEAIPGRRFVFQWTPADSTTTVALDLQALGGGTVIQVLESGYTNSEPDLAALVECAAGWGEALALLKMYLEHGAVYGPVPKAPAA